MNPFSKRPSLWLSIWLFLVLISGLIIHFVQNLAVAFVAIMSMVFSTVIFILGSVAGMAEALYFEMKDANVHQPENTISKPESFVVRNEKASLKIPEAHFWGLIGVVFAMLPIIFPYGFLKYDWQARICFGPFLIFGGFFIGYLSGPFLLTIATSMVLVLTNPLNIKPDTIGEFLLPLVGMGISYILFTLPAIKLTDHFSFIVKPIRQTPSIKTISHLEETPFPNSPHQKNKINSVSKKGRVGIWLMVIAAVSIIVKVLMTKRAKDCGESHKLEN